MLLWKFIGLSIEFAIDRTNPTHFVRFESIELAPNVEDQKHRNGQIGEKLRGGEFEALATVFEGFHGSNYTRLSALSSPHLNYF